MAASSSSVADITQHQMTAGASDNRNRWGDQTKWLAWQHARMLEVAQICDLDNYKVIFYQVAQKRAELAKASGHGLSKGQSFYEYSHCDFFGRIRTKEYKYAYREARFNCALISRESFTSDTEAKQSWPMQAPHVIAYCSRPEMGFNENGEKQIMSPYGDQYVSPYGDGWKESMRLALISRRQEKKPSGELITEIVIEFAEYYDETARQQWTTANLLYNNVLRTCNTYDFLKELGKLMHYESHLMRTYRGTESILQVIMGGIAYKKGYLLGDFRELPIGWNIMALLTDDVEFYAEWFVAEVFSSIKKTLPMSLTKKQKENDKIDYFYQIKNLVLLNFSKSETGLFGKKYPDNIAQMAIMNDPIEVGKFFQAIIAKEKHGYHMDRTHQAYRILASLVDNSTYAVYTRLETWIRKNPEPESVSFLGSLFGEGSRATTASSSSARSSATASAFSSASSSAAASSSSSASSSTEQTHQYTS